jgi:4-carboxymuconolactone decarboxylase
MKNTRPPVRIVGSESHPQTKGGTVAASPAETPVLDLLASMTADSLAVSSLDPQSLMLVRIAALAAVDAPAASYLLNLGAAADAGVDADQVRGVLAAVAPIVGSPRVVSAIGAIGDALDVVIEAAEADAQRAS